MKIAAKLLRSGVDEFAVRTFLFTGFIALIIVLLLCNTIVYINTFIRHSTIRLGVKIYAYYPYENE